MRLKLSARGEAKGKISCVEVVNVVESRQSAFSNAGHCAVDARLPHVEWSHETITHDSEEKTYLYVLSPTDWLAECTSATVQISHGEDVAEGAKLIYLRRRLHAINTISIS